MIIDKRTSADRKHTAGGISAADSYRTHVRPGNVSFCASVCSVESSRTKQVKGIHMHRPVAQIIVLLLLLCSIPGLAADPPELQEWWRIQGDISTFVGYPVSYLPNFKDGRGAIATWYDGPGGAKAPTWLLREKGDTVDQYNWGFVPRDIVAADINGDGVTDYISRFGVIRKGIAGNLPDTENIRYIEISSSYRYIIQDINRDGYDDVIANTSEGLAIQKTLFSILWGGPDLTQLKMTHIPKRPEFDSLEWFIGASTDRSANGNVRIVSQSYDEYSWMVPKWLSYVLRELVITEEQDTIKVELRTLDSLPDAAMRPAGYLVTIGALYRSRMDEPEVLLATVEERNMVELYSLANDRFSKVIEFSTGAQQRQSRLLGGSINGDDYEDWMTTGNGYRLIYAGMKNSAFDTIPFARITYPVDGQVSSAVIGDVTGDGVNDIAISINSAAGTLIIYKGIRSHTVGVDEPVAGYAPRMFDMQQNYPNPVGSERQTTVPLTVQKTGKYTLTLYTLMGRKIAELFSGYLPTGNHELHINLTPYALVPGFYSLQFSDGLHTRERGLLVE